MKVETGKRCGAIADLATPPCSRVAGHVGLHRSCFKDGGNEEHGEKVSCCCECRVWSDLGVRVKNHIGEEVER